MLGKETQKENSNYIKCINLNWRVSTFRWPPLWGTLWQVSHMLVPSIHPPHVPAPPRCPTHLPHEWPPSWQPSSRPGSHAPCPLQSPCSRSTLPFQWSLLAAHPGCVGVEEASIKLWEHNTYHHVHRTDEAPTTYSKFYAFVNDIHVRNYCLGV